MKKKKIINKIKQILWSNKHPDARIQEFLKDLRCFFLFFLICSEEKNDIWNKEISLNAGSLGSYAMRDMGNTFVPHIWYSNLKPGHIQIQILGLYSDPNIGWNMEHKEARAFWTIGHPCNWTKPLWLHILKKRHSYSESEAFTINKRFWSNLHLNPKYYSVSHTTKGMQKIWMHFDKTLHIERLYLLANNIT